MYTRTLIAVAALCAVLLTGYRWRESSNCEFTICRPQCPENIYSYCEQKCEGPATQVGCVDPDEENCEAPDDAYVVCIREIH